MDKDKLKLAAFFGDDDEGAVEIPQPKLDQNRLNQYNAGLSKKSKKDKEKDREAAKAREEEQHAAVAYAEFLDTFEGTTEKPVGNKFVRAGQSVAQEGPSKPREIRPPSPVRTSAPKPKGKRAMDSFLEEMKGMEREREAKFAGHGREGRSVTAMAAYEGQSGSKDRGDSDTSNVFVANLPPHVTEKSLGTFFAKVGAVGSVKIMWPRKDAPPEALTNGRPRSSGLTGFVSYMRRKDAEAALREFDGYEWGGCLLRVVWSKAVPVANKPAYGTAPAFQQPQSRSRSPRRSRRSRSRSYDRSRSPRRHGGRSRYHDDSRSPSRSRSRSPPRAQRKHTAEDEAVGDGFIRSVVAEIKAHDSDFVLQLKEREKDNPKYAFMLYKDHRRHVFYRGLMERDDTREDGFTEEGDNSAYSTDEEEIAERDEVRKTVLGRRAKRRFAVMLRGLTGKRGEVARCMAFSLEHAEAASEVAEIIISSLMVQNTPVPRKIARLHLICDILHNGAASVPSAWKFRNEFQARLGIIFDHFFSIYSSFPGRITADVFKKQILNIVEVWEDWIVFPLEFIATLRARLDGTLALETGASAPVGGSKIQTPANTGEAATSKFKASSFQLAAVPVASSAMDVVEDIDGEDVDGESVGDIDGEDLDGEAIDVDGEPMDDVDGEAM